MRVLIAYDGSPGAEQALGLAGALRWPRRSSLRIVTVMEPTFIYMGPLSGASPTPELGADVMAFYQERVSEAARRLSAEARTAAGVVVRGRPATVLVDEANGFEADVVIAGSRGRGAISSLLLGSVSAEVVDHAPCPVLVARAPSVRRILFATDGSMPSAAAESLLSTWPIFDGLPIDVVSVADVAEPWHSGIAPTSYREVKTAHAKELAETTAEHTRIAEDSAATLRAAGRDVRAAMRTGDAAAEIIAATAEYEADLVVIGSRGRTGLARVVLGSVARNVLQGSAASVLVVHGPKA